MADRRDPDVKSDFTLADATVAVAVITATLYAAGIGYHANYYAHWAVPVGFPSFDTIELIKKGFESGIIFGLLFFVWASASSQATSKSRKSLHQATKFLPTTIFALNGIVVLVPLMDMAQARSWRAVVLVLLIAAVFVGLAMWSLRGIAKGAFWRAPDWHSASVAVMALAVVSGAWLWGGFNGQLDGEIDADGFRSTLPRVNFTFIPGTSETKTEWRLLSHADGIFYAFDFDLANRERGRPTVYMIPDAVVASAEIRLP